MSSLRSLRQDVGRALNECFVGQIDAAAATTITDADLIDPVEADTKYAGAWIYLATGDQANTERRILRYTPATGTLTLSRAFATPPIEGDEFEIHTLIRPMELNRLLSEACAPLYYVSGYEMAIANPNQRLYGGFMADSPGNILSVVNRQAYTDLTEAQDYPVVWHSARVSETGSIVFEIEPGSITDPSGYIVARYLRRNGSLSSTNGTHVPDDYAICASLIKCYEYLMRAGPAQDVQRWERLLVYEQTRMAGLHRKYGPRGRVVHVVPPKMARWSS